MKNGSRTDTVPVYSNPLPEPVPVPGILLVPGTVPSFLAGKNQYHQNGAARYHFGTVLIPAQDQLCPPNKRFDLMDANKKFDLVCFSTLDSYSLVLAYFEGRWIKFKFLLGTKALTMNVADFRRILQLPQATHNNHAGFVDPPTFGLPQPWKTLCKIFARCLTTRVMGNDQPPVQIMQLLYCFINNVHVDYAEILWEGLHYSLMHPANLIPYPRVKNDDLVKNIFNYGKNKNGAGMKIPD
ncbi:hypothetical protein Tco_0866231 [Tanacetum coccineum]